MRSYTPSAKYRPRARVRRAPRLFLLVLLATGLAVISGAMVALVIIFRLTHSDQPTWVSTVPPIASALSLAAVALHYLAFRLRRAIQKQKDEEQKYLEAAYKASVVPAMVSDLPAWVSGVDQGCRHVLGLIAQGAAAAGTVVVVVTSVAVTVAGSNASQIALNAAQSFCDDLKMQDYTSVYNLLSTNYQGQITQTQFTQVSQLHDQIDGQVKSCVPASNNNFNLGNGPSTASFNTTVTRNRAFTGKISMVKQGSAWKVDALDPSLQGTDLGPIMVTNTFCQALVVQDYQTAHNQLSERQKQRATEAQFAAAIQRGLGASAKIVGCTPNYSTYAASVVPNTSATLSGSLNVSASGTPVNVPTTLKFVYEGGTWKIDDFTIQTS